MSIKLTEEQYRTIKPALKWDYYGMAPNYLIALYYREDLIRSLDMYLFKNDNKEIKEVRDYIANEYAKEKENGFNHEQNFYPIDNDEKKLLYKMTGDEKYNDEDYQFNLLHEKMSQKETDAKIWCGLLATKEDKDRTYFDVVKKYIDEYDHYGFLEDEDWPRDEFDTESLFIADQIKKNTSRDDIAKIIYTVMSISFGKEDFKDYIEFIDTATKIYNDIHNEVRNNVKEISKIN